MRSTPSLFRNRRRGTVLIVVMWVSLGLITIALYFAYSARMAYLGADNDLAGLRAEQAVAGSEQYLANMLETTAEAGVVPSVDDGDYEAEAVAVGDAQFWLIGRDPNGDETATTPYYGLVDEASKLNINTATLEMLELLPGMTPEAAAAIEDWRDLDSDLSAGGAEAQDYLTLDDAYIAKDDAFESVDEARLVRGMTLAILYGEDTNRNGVLDPNEDDGDASPPADNDDGKLDAGVAEYLTAWTRQPNTRADGSPRVNLRGQTARQDLEQLFNETIGAQRGQQILTTIGPALNNIESPLAFYMLSGMTESEFAQIEGSITTVSGEYQVGLVNVGTAPQAVLQCLPGMTEAAAEALVAARRGKDAESLKSVAWVASAIDQNIAGMIGPYITAQSYQFSADIAAVGQDGRGFRRAFVVFDKGTAVNVIYRRDMTRFGRALGAREQGGGKEKG